MSLVSFSCTRYRRHRRRMFARSRALLRVHRTPRGVGARARRVSLFLGDNVRA